jgi:XRE family transcriptional regulator, regulator of sulfur utilization
MPRARTYNADAIRFGAMLRQIRMNKGWTLRKLATRSGMNPTYVGIVEEGGNVPSLSTVLELTEVLGADVAEIMRQLARARTAPVAPVVPFVPVVPDGK